MITCSSIGRLGRFGNACFQVAGILGIATQNGQPYGFPEFIIYDNEKFGDSADNINDYLVNRLPLIPEGINFNRIPYFWDYREFKLPIGNWDITGHFQDERYFKHCMPLIRETFRFNDEQQQNDYVAIHYRAGDYIDDPNAYHPRQTFDYYAEALSYFSLGQKYWLFSDEPEVIQNMIGVDSENCRVWKGNSYIEDFKLMKRCKSFITANSSFSLFAAILGEHPEKKIVCPKKWFGKAADIFFNGYPENAIII